VIDIPDDELDERAGRLLTDALRRTHLSAPDDVSTVMAEEARGVGIDGLVMYLVDHEQKVLVPVPGPDTGDRDPLSANGTVAGRCFAGSAMIDSETGDGRRLWVPLLDGTDRLGVLELAFAGRRDELSPTEPMTTASELIRALVPPGRAGDGGLRHQRPARAGVRHRRRRVRLRAHDGLLHVRVLDGVGHGLAAAGVTTFALSVYRGGRRAALDLPAITRRSTPRSPRSTRTAASSPVAWPSSRCGARPRWACGSPTARRTWRRSSSSRATWSCSTRTA
jgi:hypothetical protein